MGQLSHKRLKRLKGAGKQSFQIPLNHRRSSTKTLFTPCRACALNKQLQKVKKHIQEWCYTHNTYKILSSHIYLFATACFMAHKVQIIKQYLVINTYIYIREQPPPHPEKKLPKLVDPPTPYRFGTRNPLNFIDLGLLQWIWQKNKKRPNFFYMMVKYAIKNSNL